MLPARTENPDNNLSGLSVSCRHHSPYLIWWGCQPCGHLVTVWETIDPRKEKIGRRPSGESLW